MQLYGFARSHSGIRRRSCPARGMRTDDARGLPCILPWYIGRFLRESFFDNPPQRPRGPARDDTRPTDPDSPTPDPLTPSWPVFYVPLTVETVQARRLTRENLQRAL